MDSGEFNKIAGAVLGAFLLFLLLGFFSEQIYHRGGHDEVLAYAVEIEGAGEAADEAESVDLAALVASADASAGERLFRQCSACHKVEDGANGVGPHLWGLVGRDIASAAGFSYSDALAGKEGVWDLESLDAFLTDPKGWAPGTKMAYGGMKKAEDRVNLIVWLNEADGSPAELAAAPAESATDAAEEPADAAVEAAAEAVESAAEAVTGAAESAAEAVTAAASEAVEAATETATEAADTAQEAVTAAAGPYAAASAEAGAKVFNKCKACHTLEEGKHRVGPSLWGVVGREIAGTEGFAYSDALKAVEGTWTAANLDAFLADPKGFAPGNKMSFAGVRKPEERADLIVYLNEADGSPAPLE